jgi:hypothetical protein
MKAVFVIVMGVWAMGGGTLAIAQVQPAQDRINTAIARARQVGIPVALLERKVSEGKAKGVSTERIAEAIERRQAALEQASQALVEHQGVGDADLSVAADALESGASPAAVRTLAAAAPQARRAVALAALAQLLELGYGSDVALARVRDALTRGPNALANLPGEAAAAAGRRGGPPPTTSGASGGRGQAGPPAGVPAPGTSSQPTRPGRPPASPGAPTAGAGAARGSGGG